MTNKIPDKDEWLTHKLKFWIQIIVITVGILGAWSALDKSVALIKQDVLSIKENHLKHIEEDIDSISSDTKILSVEFSDFRDRFTILETSINIFLDTHE